MLYVFGLFQKYAELRVMRFLFLSGQGFHLKEIARRTKTSPATVSKLLAGLLKDGLIKKQIVGNAHIFKADTENPIARGLKVLINLLLLQQQNIVEKILGVDENAHTIVLYGSFANGTNDNKSDLDLLIITNSKTKFDSVARQLENKIGVPVNIGVFSMLDWKKCRQKNKPFYDSIKTNHFVLHGSGLF